MPDDRDDPYGLILPMNREVAGIPPCSMNRWSAGLLMSGFDR